MEIVTGFVRASVDAIMDAGWVRAELHWERKRNPFTQEEQEFQAWRPERTQSPAEPGMELPTILLSPTLLSDEGARENAALQGGLLHDGMLVDLWAIMLDDQRATAAWKPSFMWPGARDRSLFEFPVDAVEQLAKCEQDEVGMRWARTAYVRNFYVSSAARAAHDLLQVIVACSQSGDAPLYAVSNGYISA